MTKSNKKAKWVALQTTESRTLQTTKKYKKLQMQFFQKFATKLGTTLRRRCN